jgi:hypothetical protein
MGEWNTGYFGNDGSAELLDRLGRAPGAPDDVGRVLAACFDDLEKFYEREKNGLAYRPMSREEEELCDRALAEALKEYPELLESSRRTPGQPSQPVDTGDSEALAAGAAAALICRALGADFVRVPKTIVFPADYQPDSVLVERAAWAVACIASHARVGEFVSKGWLKNVAKLASFLAGRQHR